MARVLSNVIANRRKYLQFFLLAAVAVWAMHTLRMTSMMPKSLSKYRRYWTAVTTLISFAVYVGHGDKIQRLSGKMSEIDGKLASFGHRLRNRFINRKHAVVYAVYMVFMCFLRYESLEGESLFNPDIYDNFIIMQTINTYIAAIFVNHTLMGRNRLHILTRILEEKADNSLDVGKLSRVNALYLDTIRYCKDIKDVFQVPVCLFAVTNTFIATYISFHLFYDVTKQGTHPYDSAYYLFSILDKQAETLLVVYAGASVTEQSKLLADSLQRLAIDIKMNLPTKLKIKLFLMEMIDEMFVYKLCGFLTLDFGGYVSIVGSISLFLFFTMQLKIDDTVKTV